MKESKRTEYIEKFREYKKEYVRKWHRVDNNKEDNKYKQELIDFIEYMRPYNKELKDNKITKEKMEKTRQIFNNYIDKKIKIYSELA